jgi:hypothetical protein
MTGRSSHLLLAVLIGAAFMLAGGEPLHACSCMGPNPPCQAVWQAGAVFTGEVISMTDVDQSIEGRPTVVARGRRARVRVVESFRGTQTAEVDVFTGAGGGDCGFGFVQGARYLIYAYQEPNGRLSTGICSRTALVSKAAEDLEYLRGPARDPAVFGRIFGRAEREVLVAGIDGPPDRSPYPDARITVTGGGRSYRATSGADGRYEVRVPPGEYQVTADVAEGWYATAGVSKAEVLDTRGCVQSDVFVRPDGRVSGRVVDADGRAVQGLLIDLAQERQFQRPEVSPYFRLRTDGNGRFEFTRLPPGRYYLGSNLQQNPREALPVPLFYPGVPARTSAEVVVLGLAERRRLDDFVLPASFELVRVSGVVFLPDGRPAARIRVYSWLGEKGYNLLGEPVITNPDGRFSLLVSAGYLYRVSVEHLAANGSVSARVESQPFKASSDLAPLVLRLGPVKSPDR